MKNKLLFHVLLMIATQFSAMEIENAKATLIPLQQTVNAQKIRKYNEVIKNVILDKLIDFAAKNPKDIFKPLDAFVGMSMETRKLFGAKARNLKQLASTIAAPVIIEKLRNTYNITGWAFNPGAVAKNFFTYLTQHPELVINHGGYIQALKKYVLNQEFYIPERFIYDSHKNQDKVLQLFCLSLHEQDVEFITRTNLAVQLVAPNWLQHYLPRIPKSEDPWYRITNPMYVCLFDLYSYKKLAEKIYPQECKELTTILENCEDVIFHEDSYFNTDEDSIAHEGSYLIRDSDRNELPYDTTFERGKCCLIV